MFSDTKTPHCPVTESATVFLKRKNTGVVLHYLRQTMSIWECNFLVLSF